MLTFQLYTHGKWKRGKELSSQLEITPLVTDRASRSRASTSHRRPFPEGEPSAAGKVEEASVDQQ